MKRKSTKIIGKIGKIVLWCLAGFLILDLLLVAAFFIKPVQNAVVDAVTRSVSENWGSDIAIETLYLTPTLKLVINGFEIRDYRNNEMIRVNHAKGRIKNIKLAPLNIKFGVVEGSDAKVVVRRYEGDEKVNIAIWAEIFKKRPKKEFLLSISRLHLENAEFLYRNDDELVEIPQNEIDYAYFQLGNIMFDCLNFTVHNDDIAGKITHLALQQYSGFKILNATADFRINSKELLFNNSLVVTPYSHIFMDLAFQYNDWESYGDFVDSVVFHVNANPSTINTKDIAFFVPSLKGMDNSLILKGKVDGPVNDMRLQNFNLYYGNQTFLIGNFHLKSITEFSNAFFDLNIKKSNFDLAELATVALPQGGNLQIPSLLQRMHKTNVVGTFKGKLTQFDTDLKIKSTFGDANLVFSTDELNEAISFHGNLDILQMELGNLINQSPTLGKVSLQTQIEGNAALADNFNDFFKSVKANLHGSIPQFQFKEYIFKNFVFNGTYLDKLYNLNLVANDPNCKFDFDGRVDFTREIPNYQFTLSDFDILADNIASLLAPVDSLHAKGVDKLIYFLQQKSNSQLAVSSLRVNLSATNLDDLTGSIMLDTLRYQQDGEALTTSALRFIALNVDDVKKYRLTSDILNASVSTTYSNSTVLDSLYYFACRYLPNLNDKCKEIVVLTDEAESNNEKQTDYFSAQIETYHTRKILSFFRKGTFIAPLTKLNFYMSSKHENDSIYFSSRYIRLNPTLKFHNIKIRAKEEEERQIFITSLLDSLVLVGEKSNLKFSNIDLAGNVKQNLAIYQLKWVNPEVVSNLPSNLDGSLYFKTLSDLTVSIFNTSEISLKQYKWHFNEDNKIRISDEEVAFENLALIADKSSIKLDGIFSKKRELPLKVDINKVDLAILNSFLDTEMFNFSGEISAEVNFLVEDGKKVLNGRALISDLEFNNSYFGNAFVLANLPTQQDIRFVGGLFLTDTLINSSDVNTYTFNSFEKEKGKIALINGGYNIPSREFAVYTNVSSIDVDFLQPYLASFSNVVKGDAAAELAFIAKPDTFYFDGKVIVKDAEIGIAPLNTVYTIKNQKIDFNKKGMLFANVELRDKYNNIGYLKGTLLHQKFKQFQLDLSVETKRLLALNTPKTLDMPFYGDGFVEGKIKIQGDENKLKFVGTDLVTCKGTTFYLPLYFSESTSESNIIIFKSPYDLPKNVAKKEDAEKDMELDFDFRFIITPDALVEIELDPSIGGTLQARVEGPLRMIYNSEADLELTGDLTIQSGSFHLTLKDIIDKMLSLTPGGTINFLGPIDLATINLKAVYKTTASLNEIIPPDAVSGGGSLRRTPVNTFVHLKGNLFNPVIDFSFELPNSSNDISTLFYSAIDTTVVENRTRQFFSLLVLGKFESSERNSSNMVTSAVEHSGMELLTNSINNFISQNLKYVDIGLKYRNADDTHAEEYSISASTSLLNDRMIIEGSFGYANDKGKLNDNGNNFIGDYSMEYALNEDKNWRVKVFNVTNQYSSLTQTSPYAQGVAVIYKKEFNNKKDFVNKWKRKKKEKKRNKNNQ